MENSIKVIVIGGNHHNTLGVIRSLGRAGIMPYVILTSGGDESFVLKSKYIKKAWTVKGSDGVVDLLLKEFTSFDGKNVLIGCHDAIASVFDLNRDKLNPYFIVPGAELQGAISPLMYKKNMGELAERIGLKVPRMMVSNFRKYPGSNKPPFPCITKPVESKSGSKSEIKIFDDEEKLLKFLKSDASKEFVIQQFIDKAFEFQLIGCSLDGGKDIIIPGVSVILRQSKSSNTGFLQYKVLDDSFGQTVGKTKSFIQSIGYSGLFSVEFLRDKTGTDYFLEMNYRNDGNTISVFNAGINLPYIWYLHSIGEDYKKEIKPIHEEFVMPEFAELALYQQGLISRKEWKQDMGKATSYMDYAPDDPAPTNGWSKYNKQKSFAVLRHWKHKLFDK